MFSLQVDDETSLSLYTPRDFDELHALVTHNIEHLAEWMPWAVGGQTPEETRAYLSNVAQRLRDGSEYACGIRWRGQLVGGIGLHMRDRLLRKGEIGYWLGREYSGRGIVTRAARALTDFGFTELGLHRMVIRTATENTRSAAVAGRLGFQREATLRDDVWGRGQITDSHLFGMLASDWTVTTPHPVFARQVDSETDLRLLEERHSSALFTLLDTNRAWLQTRVSWMDRVGSEEAVRAFIRWGLQQWAVQSGLRAGIWYRGQLVGGIGYQELDHNNRTTEIAYWLAEAFTGRGIMTRAVRALTDDAFRRLGLNRVTIICTVDNHASCAIPQRLGFTHEGVWRQAHWQDDHYLDCNVYAMLAADWPPAQEAS